MTTSLATKPLTWTEVAMISLCLVFCTGLWVLFAHGIIVPATTPFAIWLDRSYFMTSGVVATKLALTRMRRSA